MRSQRCTQCGTRLDVSRMEEGAKFTCSNCSAVLVVGDVPVTKKSLSDSGPQFSPRSKKDRKEAPAVQTRTRRTRERTDAPRSSSGSKMPLFIGAGVVAVAAIVLAVVNMGDGPGSSGPPPQVAWWNDTQANVGGMSADELRAAIRHAKSRGWSDNAAFWNPKADVLYKALLAKAPADEEANRFYGRKALQGYEGFEELWAGMEQHQTRMDERFLRFYEKHIRAVAGGKKVWLSEEDYDRAAALLDSFASWKKKVEADPTPQLVEKGLMRVGALTTGFGAVPAAELPVIVFLGSRELGKDAEESVREAKRRAFAPRVGRVKKRARAVQNAWQEQIAAPLGLPPFEKGSPFFVYCLDSREAFDALASREGRGLEFDVGSPLLFFWRTADPAAFGLIPATPEEDEWFESDLAHVLVHMFQKRASKDPKDKWGRPMEEWNGLWLVEGLAEYVGGGCRDDGSFTGVSPKRQEFLKQADNAGVLLFLIRDIVRASSYQTYERFMRDAYWPQVNADRNAPESVGAFYQSVGGRGAYQRQAFQAQCWYLCYFLNHYGDGKYKEKFRTLVKSMLQGRRDAATGERYESSEDAFAKVMGLSAQADWDALQQEYDDWIPAAVGSER